MGARTVTVKLAELTEHLGCGLFCKSCVYRHFLVKGSRICPKCNMMLSPRPIATLISDKKLQDVVDRIFPEYKAQEEIDEREFYTNNNFKLKENAPTEAEKDGVSESPQRENMNARALPMLKFPFMQVNGNFKMSELCKLIHRRLRLSDDVQVEIACMGTAVGPELSVHFILRTIWQHQNQQEPLVLHYRHATS
ncbi:hypothetical protein BBJ29_001263 [Phytophthora kernoviae]|uniref:RAWUL domain-containing protein n=1 Tax=Phytophthora kernoviae TaxID=325452 RepID=A0A3F2S3M1_9STRA|nr:hypothetical protein BBJ29_001263 [Phytophthora kernoviae]RLN69633.1 hypothetical protein BBP00_00000234 [Phytophthora kernoviae]